MRWKHIEEYSRFAIGASLVFLAELVLTIFLTEYFGWYFLKAYFTSLVLGTFLLTLYNGAITFNRIKTCGIEHRIICTVVVFLMYIADVLSLYVLESIFGIHYILGIILITPPFSILNFYVNKQFLHHKDQPKERRISGWRKWYQKRKR